jgi:hypothetical protein
MNDLSFPVLIGRDRLFRDVLDTVYDICPCIQSDIHDLYAIKRFSSVHPFVIEYGFGPHFAYRHFKNMDIRVYPIQLQSLYDTLHLHEYMMEYPSFLTEQRMHCLSYICLDELVLESIYEYQLYLMYMLMTLYQPPDHDVYRVYKWINEHDQYRLIPICSPFMHTLYKEYTSMPHPAWHQQYIMILMTWWCINYMTCYQSVETVDCTRFMELFLDIETALIWLFNLTPRGDIRKTHIRLHRQVEVDIVYRSIDSNPTSLLYRLPNDILKWIKQML